MRKKRRLWDEYRFPGFHPRSEVQGVFGDHKARVISLRRRQKKQPAVLVGPSIEAFTTGRYGGFETCRAEMREFIWIWRSDVSFAGGVAR